VLYEMQSENLPWRLSIAMRLALFIKVESSPTYRENVGLSHKKLE